MNEEYKWVVGYYSLGDVSMFHVLGTFNKNYNMIELQEYCNSVNYDRDPIDYANLLRVERVK